MLRCDLGVQDTDEIVVVFDIASNGHLASTVTAGNVPFAPIEGVDAPWRKVVTVGGSLVLLVHERVGWTKASFGIHARVCAWSDISQPEWRLRCIGGRCGRVVLLRRRRRCVLGLLRGVREGYVFLFGTHTSWARARVRVRGGVLRLADGVGARGKGVRVGVADDVLGGYGRRSVRGGGPWALGGLEATRQCRGRAVVGAVWCGLLDADVGRHGPVRVGLGIHLLLLLLLLLLGQMLLLLLLLMLRLRELLVLLGSCVLLLVLGAARAGRRKCVGACSGCPCCCYPALCQ